jgi:LysM repeat protein
LTQAIQRLLLFISLVIPVVVASMLLPRILGSQRADAEPTPTRLPQTDLASAPTPVQVPAAATGTPVASIRVTPPPTLAPPPVAASPSPSPRAQERVVVGNTGGIGAVLRSAPISGQPVASLRDGQTLEVLERTRAGGEEWVRVRLPSGQDGWIVGRAAVPASPATGLNGSSGQPGASLQPGATAVLRSTAVAPNAAPSPPGRRTYVVQRGDELKAIAAQFGVSIQDILAVNDIPNPDSLRLGQELVIPDS